MIRNIVPLNIIYVRNSQPALSGVSSGAVTGVTVLHFTLGMVTPASSNAPAVP